MARTHRQAAVVPYRITNAHLEVALVTTSSGMRWIVPKGSVEVGERPRNAASREAKEEAGLRGVIARKRLGRYRYVKGDGLCRVDVYLMRVTDVLDRWPQDSFRRRRWLRIADAVVCVREELRPFLHAAQSAVGGDSGVRRTVRASSSSLRKAAAASLRKATAASLRKDRPARHL